MKEGNLKARILTNEEFRKSKALMWDRVCYPTDFTLMLGARKSSYLGGAPVDWWIIPKKMQGSYVDIVNYVGDLDEIYGTDRLTTCRPVLNYSDISPKISVEKLTKGLVRNKLVVEYGEYPQSFVGLDLNAELEKMFKSRMLNGTGKCYTADSNFYSNEREEFEPRNFDEYEYKGQKYIRMIGDDNSEDEEISNSSVDVILYEPYWIKVEPIKWIVDARLNLMISEKALFSNIQFLDVDMKYDGNFENTRLSKFLNDYFIKEISGSKINIVQDSVTPNSKNKFEKKRNPYKFNMDKVSEEDIIRGSIESGISVFLHGPSSEGKSARVKQIDPTCEIIYLRNASPESLNGKSVYNQNTGEIIDVKPSWLKRVEEKCKKEPDKLHIVFLDEITNALPSIQGIAFNIVLDREVNGKWKLPDNARIVAAGNDVKDSLAANELAEPLFNRFAHVYITTTKESWLQWASENNIHPAIYAYIAYKDGKTLRSKYDGKKPNADPRKWEMASKMLYQTNNPEMLRALVGDDITREFVEFCNQRVITVEDVINGNYTEEEIEELNTSERYATTMGLSQVGIEEVEKVREFVKKIGPEFIKIFDVLWTHNDEERLEKLAEINTSQDLVKGLRKDGR